MSLNRKSLFIIFPNQLFEDIAALKEVDEVFLVEEHLFFNQYKFHKQKLVFHRASMKYYESYLKENQIKVTYVESIDPRNKIQNLITSLDVTNNIQIKHYDVCDFLLDLRINKTCSKHNIELEVLDSPLFLNNKEDLKEYFGSRMKYFHNDFYIQQRKKRHILVDENNKPIGGKWSFDADNRSKYPKDRVAPDVEFPAINSYYTEAIAYINLNYNGNYGEILSNFRYPTTHEESRIWLDNFLKTRLEEFGVYEDAIVDDNLVLHHSVLTPMLNAGLLTPLIIINTTMDYASENQIPLNSLEGFIRQIIGWREFIRGVYLFQGSKERTTNFWGFKKKIPASFYNGTTGIKPIDSTIKKILETGYCHHIERLMILGNFMVLNEFDPDEVYQWFMELFIDAYDWVMVPNIYGMSQFADGGLMATKPYISGSSYVLKMSNYKKGDWCAIWDALFWNFMNKQRSFFLLNPRLGMLIHTFDKMSEEKKSLHITTADQWLEKSI
jgi:deoxyribodipyrimidine photolyase-related protein